MKGTEGKSIAASVEQVVLVCLSSVKHGGQKAEKAGTVDRRGAVEGPVRVWVDT